MRTRLLLALFISVPALARSESADLKDAFEAVRSMPECQDRIGLEMSKSLPIPIKTARGVRYRQMFYTLKKSKSGYDPEAQVMAPAVVAEYDLDGTGLDCGVTPEFPPSELLRPLGPWGTAHRRALDYEAGTREATTLLALIQSLGEAFSGKRTDAKTKAQAKDFQRRFALLSEPGLSAHYRALSPEFWAWLDSLDAKKKPAK